MSKRTHCGKLLRSGNNCRKLVNHKGRHRGTQHDMSRWLAKLERRAMDRFDDGMWPEVH